MISRKRVIEINGARYIGLPKGMEVRRGEEVFIVHDGLLAFASPKLALLSDSEFEAEVEVILRFLRDARALLRLKVELSREVTENK